MPSTQNISDFRFFPVEILEIIFRIALARSSATASSVIRLNHGWRALLEPMMYQKIIFETETQLDLFMRRVSRKNKSRVNDLTIALNHIKWEPEYIDGLESLANLKASPSTSPRSSSSIVLRTISEYASRSIRYGPFGSDSRMESGVFQHLYELFSQSSHIPVRD
ncbi:hypothetical protein SISSUDRAFT_1050516 [Sistotremastrum suecicum HHB10207 ss-3]|uniref:Uncharacterized protein n=1 Tax=Sistotremastrum suecicum HHB10207 ss-3 TaxID=1314776 RepID=A0A166B533_9AGAM|nr:hypothetical protein SISSUDRAFT_1050516 [Sistotremastrum suecicum HHB10207 ss-3]